MSIAENTQKNDEQRRVISGNLASQLLDELPEKWQQKLESKVVDLLLSAPVGFNTEAASAYIAEKCSEWAELPGNERHRHLRSNALEQALAT